MKSSKLLCPNVLAFSVLNNLQTLKKEMECKSKECRTKECKRSPLEKLKQLEMSTADVSKININVMRIIILILNLISENEINFVRMGLYFEIKKC